MQKVLLVDDNPNVLYSFKRTLHSGNRLWEIYTAESGASALEIINQVGIDIIVSDLRMPEMDGVELLGIVAKVSPSTLRIALTGDADPVLCQQATLVAHQFVNKPCSPADLARIIDQIICVDTLVIKPEVKREISKIANLPSQPSLYAQLIAELNKNDVNLDHVSQVVSQDMSMTAKILQLVNSAYFGLAREVSEVSQAVFYLGMETIRDLALSVHLFSQFDEVMIARAGLGDLWDHSLRVASCSRAIVSSTVTDKKMIASSFTAGLLHDIGKLILGTTSPSFYISMNQVGINQVEKVLSQEKREFGSTHAEIGAYLLGIWGLPMEIIHAVADHHYYERLDFIHFSPSISVWFANAYVDEYTEQNSLEGFPLTQSMLQNKLFMEKIELWNNCCKQVLSR